MGIKKKEQQQTFEKVAPVFELDNLYEKYFTRASSWGDLNQAARGIFSPAPIPRSLSLPFSNWNWIGIDAIA